MTKNAIKIIPRVVAVQGLSDEDASKLAAALPGLLEITGLSLDLTLPADDLWRQAVHHDRSTSVHIVSLGATLLQIRADTSHGDWLQRLEQFAIPEQRAQEAVRIVRWALEANNRALGCAGKITQIGTAKLIQLSRIPLEELEKSGLSLEEASGLSWRKMRSEISRLKNRLKKAEAADPNQSLALEKEARNALRAVKQGYQDYSDALAGMAALASGWHGNARRGVAGRLESAGDALTQEVDELIEARIHPALAQIRHPAKKKVKT